MVNRCLVVHGSCDVELRVVVGHDAKSSRGSALRGPLHAATVPAARSPSPEHGFHSTPALPSLAMPPRKKAKASAASTPLGDTQPKTPQESGPSQSQDDLHSGPWADEQETQLFKSM